MTINVNSVSSYWSCVVATVSYLLDTQPTGKNKMEKKGLSPQFQQLPSAGAFLKLLLAACPSLTILKKSQWFYYSLNIINHASVSLVIYSEKSYRNQKPQSGSKPAQVLHYPLPKTLALHSLFLPLHLSFSPAVFAVLLFVG